MKSKRKLARIRFPLLGLVLTALAGGTAAQEGSAPPVFGEQVEVALVNVDVWVTDAAGRPVTGLDAGSFEVLHDGQPVEISHFAEVRSGSVVGTAPPPGVEADATAAGRPAQPSHLIFYFDESRLHPSRLEPLLRGLGELLDAEAVDPANVLIVRQGWNLQVEAPFGSTEDQLRQALQRLTKGDARGVAFENETRLALDAIRDAWEEADDLAGSAAGGIAMIPSGANPGGDSGTGAGGIGGNDPRSVVGGVGSGGGPDRCGLFVNQIRPTLDAWARSRSQRIAVTLAALSDLTGFLAGLPGVKTLVYLSDGLDTKPGIALATYASNLCPGAGSELMRSGNIENTTDRLLALTRHANTNRVTVQAVQASGLNAPRTTSAVSARGARSGRGTVSLSSFESAERSSARDGMILIADQTGGDAVFDRNELGPEFLKIGEASRNYYSLTYEPPKAGADSDRKSHRIDVELADGSLTARYRRGYLEKDSKQWMTERIEGALNLGITSNPLGVRLGAGAPQPGDDGTQRLPLQVIVPVERLALLPQAAGHAAEIALTVFTRDLAEGTLTVSEGSFKVKGAPGATGFAKLPIVLELGEGRYLTAVGVQDLGSGEASFVTTMLDSRAGG